jgi:hypothetical protein
LSALLLVTAAGPLLSAQSLADVAKREEERRRTIKEPSKVYTNKDLTSVPPSASDTGKPAAGAIPPSGEAAKDADKPKSGEPVKDQKYWSGRLKALQTQLERDQSFAEALQSRINALTTDFTARDDPAQRAVIARDRLKAATDLDRLKQAIVTDKKAIADLEEEARKAGVPPGWLRF